MSAEILSMGMARRARCVFVPGDRVIVPGLHGHHDKPVATGGPGTVSRVHAYAAGHVAVYVRLDGQSGEFPYCFRDDELRLEPTI